jgi:predicted  nucleic acid-binding Zn-ribbon protein
LAELKLRETRQTKTNAQLQQQLLAANEKVEKLNAQLNERKKEMKKLEKKAKSEAQLSSENSELHDKVESLTKELSQVQRQLNEEQVKYKRDTQSLADSKKHLHVELNARYTENQKVTNQLEEKTQALKKIESQFANERKTNSSAIATLTERAKKAEINFLEHKLEDGLRVLERARDDCQMQIRTCEEQLKKHHIAAETDVIKKNIAAWQSKQDEVVNLIAQAKTDFSSHIAALKSGKQLSQLPKIQVPKPPPCPKLYDMPVSPPQVPSVVAPIGTQTPSRVPVTPLTGLPLERKVITPPNSRSRAAGATTPQFTQPPPQVAANTLIMSPSSYQQQPSSQPASASVTPIKMQPPTPIAPIGVRPQNYQNGLGHKQRLSGSPPLMPPSSSTTGATNASYILSNSTDTQQQQQQYQQRMSLSSSSSQQQQQSGQFVPWGWNDPLNNISDFFGPSRSFGPLGSDFGGSPSVRLGNTVDQTNTSPSAVGATGGQAASSSNAQQSHPQMNGWTLSNDAWNSNLQGRQY